MKWQPHSSSDFSRDARTHSASSLAGGPVLLVVRDVVRHRHRDAFRTLSYADRSGARRRANTTLADLLTPLLVANPFSAVRAFLRWWASDCFEDGVTYRWQGGLRRRSVDSFFPAVLF